MNIEYGHWRMLCREPRAAADVGAVEDREGPLPAEHVVDLGRLIDDLVHGDERERHLPPVADRPIARACRADGDAGQRPFGDRRGLDPLVAELLRSAARSHRSTCRRCLGSLAASPRRRPRRRPGRRSALAWPTPSRREHVLERLLRLRERARLGERDGATRCWRALPCPSPAIRRRSVAPWALSCPTQPRDRVLLLPGFDLILGAEIRLADALGVGAPAVGLALDQRRSLASPCARSTARAAA